MTLEDQVNEFEVECIHAHAKSLGQEHMNDWLRKSLLEAEERGRFSVLQDFDIADYDLKQVSVTPITNPRSRNIKK